MPVISDNIKIMSQWEFQSIVSKCKTTVPGPAILKLLMHNVLRMGMTRTFNFGLVNVVKVLCGSIFPCYLCFRTH